MKRISVFCLFLTVLFFTIFISPATLIASEKSLIEEALHYLEQQNYQRAYDVLEEALFLIWNKAPLQLNNLLFTNDEATGFGLYNIRSHNHFAQGETFFIYAEVKNYTLKETEQKLYEIYIKEDLYIMDKENNILWGKKDFLDYRLLTHSPNKELFITNTITQNQPFPKGEYQFLIVLKDVASQKTVEKTIAFVVE